MQVLELPRQVHPYFLATQAHAELTSRPLAPSPMFTGLIRAALAYSQTGGTAGSQAHPDHDHPPQHEATPAV